MVFLFGIERSLGISSNEAAAIARFMDAGGGVLATGGHEDPVTPEVAERLFRVRARLFKRSGRCDRCPPCVRDEIDRDAETVAWSRLSEGRRRVVALEDQDRSG